MKWEYKIEKDTSNFETLGNEGWELVTVDNGTAYFKRVDSRRYSNMIKAVIEKHIDDEFKIK